MKILMIFIDMLRPNLLNTYNKSMPINRIDRQIQNWGGTVYTNCFTPAPDTPRSNACLWSSRYPRDNGCDNRLKYPGFFMKDDVEDLFKILKKHNYSFNFYMHPSTKAVGVLPICVSNSGFYSNGQILEEFLKQVDVTENSLTYISIEDFHEVVTDYYAQMKCANVGFEIVGKSLELINQYLDMDMFDQVFILSDHGFKEREKYYGNDYLKQLGRDRTQIFMLYREKGNHVICYNDKLCSIMDIYPTVCEKGGFEYSPESIEGISLCSGYEKKFIMIEDHKTFNSDLGQTIEYWGFWTKKGLACVNSDLIWISDFDITSQEKNEYENYLSERASCFCENVKMRKIRKYYDEGLVTCPNYFDGTPRKKCIPLDETIKINLYKALKVMKKIVKKLIQRA